MQWKTGGLQDNEPDEKERNNGSSKPVKNVL
jgi:hypothetical protein